MPERIKASVASVKNRLAATCSQTEASLSGYIELDLPFARRRRVAGHLRRCLRCRSLLHSLAWTVEQLRILGATEVTGRSVAETVAERIRTESAGGST